LFKIYSYYVFVLPYKYPLTI